MIITCPHCEGKMRVDEGRLTSGERTKIRCPHCKQITSVGDQTKQAGRSGSPGPSFDAAEDRKKASRSKAMDHEPSFPKDAFQDFRSTAEKGLSAASKKPKRSGLKIMIWTVVSLAIVAFFALLVNLILPGPTGQRFFGGSGMTKQAIPKAPSGNEFGPSLPPGAGR
jgi:predicted Zn finger-like uncharacterized protein